MDINLEIKLECKVCGDLIEVHRKREFHYEISPCESCEKEKEEEISRLKEDMAGLNKQLDEWEGKNAK